jgi:4-amino-4-deoxy-L-arabinose transferase-like glycosyltransferase
MSTNARQYIVLLVIMCGSAILLLANLGNQYLWQDEAETALVSKTILTNGVPRSYDGKNFFSQEGDAGNDKSYIWRHHTWLPFYVLAGFYKVFGVSTFVSRLPFVLFGVGTVFLTFFFARQVWPSTRVPVIAAALLAISVPFLLLCRQCRYYSMTMFFSVLSLYAYVALLQRKKYAAVLLFVASTLLFHSQHIYVAVFFATVLLHSVIFHRDRLKLVLVAIAATVLVNVPWFVWLVGTHSSQMFVWRLLDMPKLFTCVRTLSTDVVRYVFPLWVLAVVLIVVFVRRVRTGRFFSKGPRFWEKVSLPVFFVIFNVIAVVTLSHFMFFRYIAPSILLLVVLIAVIIDAAASVHLLLAVATAALLVATGQLKDYFYEITHDYDGPEEGIARYLNEHGSPEDTVAITYGDMSLKLYTGMRVVGGFTGENLEPAKNARWVIIRKYILYDKDAKVGEYLINNIEWNRYRRIMINYPDIPWENRESPSGHLFRTCTDEDKVAIYERID